MTNKKRFTISVLCLLMLIVSMFAFSACGGKVENFNLSFKVDGESYSTISTNGSEVVAIPENPTKEGYTFDGWYWDKDVWSKPFTANSLLDAPISSDMSVYAKFSAIKYDITYENDGGTHSNPVSYTIEDSFALSAAERQGYTFVGWYSDAAYTTKVESVSAGSKGAITLYAKFEINNYTISYGNTMDAVNSNVTSYNVNTDTITLSDLSKTGYVFEGWYNGDEKVTEIAKGSTGNITLTAKWSVIGYDITYHNVDGATNSNPIAYDVEDQPLALSDASKDGYRFLGWYTDAALTNKVSEIAIGTIGDINLYAKWELIEYTVTFKDGDTIVETVKFTVVTESITEPAVPNHVGYTGAWESYSLGTENITVNAVYTLISYGITYNNVSGTTNNNPATYNVEDQPLTLVDASKDHYTFLGWYSDAAFTNRVTEISVGTTGDVALYARWEAIEYTATFMDGDTEVGKVKFTVESESITEPAVPNHVGYTGAWESYTLGTEDITIKAVYSLVTYGITYNNVSGATNSNPTTYNVEDQPLALVDASKDHYTFLGWYSDAEFNNEVTEISVGTTGPVVLYAKWEAIEYTATFMDGDTEVGKVKFTVESESITEPAVPNHVGYTGAWESYTLGTEDITIKAVYSLVTYGITYNNVSGATNSNPTTYNVEDQPLALVDASKDHYTFLGWYSDAEFNNEVTEISVGTTGPVMLYAKWEAVEYAITFLYDKAIGDYAEGTVVKTTYTVEDEFEFATLVCKTAGYTFDGWFTEKNVGTGTKVTGVTKGTSGNITVYAQFGLEEYDITYNNVNGSTNKNPTRYNAASEEFTIYPLTKEGYTFDGWFANEECTTPANLTITKGSSGDITLYAKWTPITYTIDYVTYGGTATGNPATYIITDSITFNNATLSGYVFKGWYTAAEGGSKVTGITAGTTGNIILYAHWDYVSTITFESNGGSPVNSISNVEGTAISAPVAPTKEHYTFAGWYSDAALKNVYSFATQPAEDITLYAKWTPVVYEIEYVLNGGTNSENNVVEYTVEDKIELYAPSKVGYTFIGWFTDAEFTSSVVTELKVGTSGKITLYAHYSVNQYTISFESNGGTSVSAITQNYATSVTAPEAPSKNGYTFAGWYSNASLTSRYTFSTMPADNITLYAKWNLETYNITYNLNGGTNNSFNPATYTITSAKITLKAPTKTGYSFAGWYNDAECTEAISEIASGSYGVVELFAKWTATEYTITYVTADGATHSNILTYTNETDLTTLADATLKGHAFGGWYTDDSYATAVTTVAGGEIGNKTIYAKFTANTYNVWLDGNEEASYVVSFNLNGAEGTIASQTVTPTATLKYPTVPTRDGYIFAGWYENENCTGSLYDFTAVVTSDTTLYAKWVKVENATAIAINGSSNVTLNGKYEQMLMFIPLVSGNITITASGSYDTFGVLYSSEMVALAQDDDNAYDESNFLIVYNVTAGETYYIGARAFSSTTTGTATVSIAGSTTVMDGGYAITASKGSATYGQNFTLNVPNAREGYKFLGYADENGVMYTDATGASVKVWDKDSETTLVSKWERTVYTVIFVTNGGSEIDDVTLAAGTRFNINQYITTRANWSFVGWYDNAACSGDVYNASVMPDENIILYAKWVKYGLGDIKYDIDKTYISVDDEITAELFSVMCLDTNGDLVVFALDSIDGTVAAGETITIRFKPQVGTGVLTISNIKVYGSPTLTFDNTIKYFNVKDGLSASWYNASGTDTYGASTAIDVYVDGYYEAGDYVTIVIEAKDIAGNSTYGYIEDVMVYGAPVISYDTTKTVIKTTDTINSTLFNLSAVDSFGETVTVSATRYSGTMSAGNVIVIRLTATDSKGNTSYVDVSVSVYGSPTITAPTKTDFKETDLITIDALGITAQDSFGNALNVSLTIEGEIKGGNIVVCKVSATDIAGNTTNKEYSVKIYGAPVITYDRDSIDITDDVTAENATHTVTFYLNGGTGTAPAKQTISATVGLTYPSIPSRSGYIFTGWYVDSECTEIFDFSKNIVGDVTVYAGWHSMSTSGYSNTAINIRNYNSSSNYYSASNSGTSSSSARYTYFTALTSGTYKLYFRNSSSSSSYRNYFYVYNVTQGKEIKAETLLSSTSWSSVSFSVNAGDVIYVRNYKYSSSSYVYFYVTGASTPEAGGKCTLTGANDILNAKAVDSFGNELKVVASTDTVLVGGQYVIYTLTAEDSVGNITTINTAPIAIYDINDIDFEQKFKQNDIGYMAGASNFIKLTSKGEEFYATATDSFGNLCDISIEAAEGFTLEAGKTITIYLVATDKVGNKVYSEAIPNIMVYGMPTITQTKDVLEVGVNYAYFFTVTDTFGEEVYSEVTLKGEMAIGNLVYLQVTATDYAGNTVMAEYPYIVSGNGYTYKSNGSNIVLTNYTGTSKNVVVADGCTEIAEKAFANNTTVESISVPNSVTKIGKGAFSGCSSLKQITLPFVGGSSDITEPSANSLFGFVFGTDSYEGGTSTRQSYGSSSTTYYIPSSLKTVIINGGNLQYGAFYNCANIETVTLNTTELADYAFYGCTNLTSVKLSSRIEAVNTYAFYNCSNLVEITGTENITDINSYAFSGCSKLETVTFANVIKIEEGAFYNCTKLTNVEFGDNLTSIGNYAFAYCSALKNISFTNNLVSIGDYAFRSCTSLESVTIPSAVESIGTYAFAYCTSIKTLDFDEAKTSIGSYAFSGCTSIKEIVLSDDITSLGTYAFNGCSSLESVKIGNGIKTISERAFYGCTNLTNVQMGSSVTSIGTYAFANCTKLYTITIGSKVTSIGSNAFYYCYKLIEVINESKLSIQVGSSSYGYAGYYAQHIAASKEESYLNKNEDGYVFYDDGTMVYLIAYHGDATNIVLPETYQDKAYAIYKYAFYNYTKVTKLTIPNMVTEIGDYAFYGATNLSNVIIGDGVSKIGSNAFYNNKKLTTVTLGTSVNSIGSNAFYYCNKLIEVVNKSALGITAGSSSYGYVGYYAERIVTDENSAGVKVDDNGFIFYDDGTNVYLIGYSGSETALVLPNNYNGKNYGIYEYAFQNQTSIISITIPSAVISIGKSAFEGCTSLTKVNYLGSVDTWSGIVFENTYANPLYYVGKLHINNVELTEITLSSSVTQISDYAFIKCENITSVTLPSGIVSIGQSSFEGCTSLTKVNYLGSVDTWCGIVFENTYANPLYYVGKLHINDVELTEITLSSSVTQISDYAFIKCENITSVTLPSGIVSIGQSVFEGCTGLTKLSYKGTLDSWCGITFENAYSNPMYYTGNLYIGGTNVVTGKLTIPSTITSIRAYAFAGASGVTEIVVPETVTSIGQGAFAGCGSLQTITLPFVGSNGTATSASSSTLFGYVFGRGPTGQYNSVQQYYSSSTYDYTYNYIPSSLKTVNISGGKILYGAFYNCSMLNDINIGEKVTSIGAYAFKNCFGLTSIIIPDSVVTIGSGALSGCGNITSLEIPFIGYSMNYSYKYPLGYIFGTTSYSGGVAIEQYYCYNDDDTKNVVYYIPSSLKSLSVNKGELHKGALHNIESLNELVVGKDITSIDEDALANTSLQSVYVDSANTAFKSNNNLLIDIVNKTLLWGYGTNVTIPSDGSITRIGAHAFACCTTLKSVSIPNTVTSIGNFAFINCSSLFKVTLPNNLKALSECIFANCSSLTSVTIPDSVVTIHQGAFYGCSSLQTIHIPKNVTRIFDLQAWVTGDSVVNYYGGTHHYDTFDGCSRLKTFTVASGNTYYYSVDGVLYDKGSTTYQVFIIAVPEALTGNITVPEGVRTLTTIFAGSKISGISLPSTLTCIKAGAFEGCTNLTTIQLKKNSDSERWCSDNEYWWFNLQWKDDNYTLSDICVSAFKGNRTWAMWSDSNGYDVYLSDYTITLREKS